MPYYLSKHTVSIESGGRKVPIYLSRPTLPDKRPVIIILHEWWGLNDYAKMRTRQLASLGYLAMAVDMFGSGKTASNPQEARELTAPYYNDPGLAKTRLDAAVKKIREYSRSSCTDILFLFLLLI